MAAPMSSVFLRKFAELTPARLSLCAKQLKRFYGAVSGAQAQPSPYDLYCGLVIERRAVITPPLSDIEKKYQQLQATWELEQSHLSKHELRHEADIALAERRLRSEVDEKETALLTAVDMEDSWTEEKMKFTPGSRITDADKSGNVHTHNRCLDKCVYLLVQQSFGGKSHWVFPQALSEDSESTRQTCERIQEDLSAELKLQYLGNAPSALHTINYPKNTVSSACPQLGAKVFLHKAFLTGGDLKELMAQSRYQAFSWLTAKEIQQNVGKTYWKSVKVLLHQR